MQGRGVPGSCILNLLYALSHAKAAKGKTRKGHVVLMILYCCRLTLNLPQGFSLGFRAEVKMAFIIFVFLLFKRRRVFLAPGSFILILYALFHAKDRKGWNAQRVRCF